MPASSLPFLLRETNHPDPELTPFNFWIKQLSMDAASYMRSDSLYALISPGWNKHDLNNGCKEGAVRPTYSSGKLRERSKA